MVPPVKGEERAAWVAPMTSELHRSMAIIDSAASRGSAVVAWLTSEGAFPRALTTYVQPLGGLAIPVPVEVARHVVHNFGRSLVTVRSLELDPFREGTKARLQHAHEVGAVVLDGALDRHVDDDPLVPPV